MDTEAAVCYNSVSLVLGSKRISGPWSVPKAEKRKSELEHKGFKFAPINFSDITNTAEPTSITNAIIITSPYLGKSSTLLTEGQISRIGNLREIVKLPTVAGTGRIDAHIPKDLSITFPVGSLSQTVTFCSELQNMPVLVPLPGFRELTTRRSMVCRYSSFFVDTYHDFIRIGFSRHGYKMLLAHDPPSVSIRKQLFCAFSLTTKESWVSEIDIPEDVSSRICKSLLDQPKADIAWNPFWYTLHLSLIHI